MLGIKLFPKAYSRHAGFNLFVALLAVAYALIMIYLLYFRDRYFFLFDSYNYNLTPFKTIQNYIERRSSYNFDTWFKNLFGNVVLFIPIGIFMPLLHTGLKRFWKLTAACLVLIFIVEILQMLLRVGSFDVDDLILNTFGAWIGLLLTRLCMRWLGGGRR